MAAARHGDENDGRAALLAVESLSLSFGGLQALRSVSMRVPPAESVALIGPNGAGKTSLLNCLTRLYQPNQGVIRFRGEQVTELPAHEMAKRGIARTFQNVSLVSGMTVLDNILLGGHSVTRGAVLADCLGLPSRRREERELRGRAEDLATRMGLSRWLGDVVDDLPFGTQKRVELARALLARPCLLLLDEPANGLADDEVVELGSLIRDLAAHDDLAMLIIDHHMGFVEAVASTVYCLNFGRVIAEGTVEQVRRDPQVIEAYLGAADVA